MFDTIYAHCAIIAEEAQGLVACKNPKTTRSQQRAMKNIHQYTYRLTYAVDSLAQVPGASMQSYIRRQLLDIITPILGSAQLLFGESGSTLNNCQLLHLRNIVENASSLSKMLTPEPNDTTP